MLLFLRGREGGRGWRWHRRKPYLFQSETTILVKQNNVNSAEEALIVQNGWTHYVFVFFFPSFPIGYNSKNSSPRKSTPLLYFSLSKGQQWQPRHVLHANNTSPSADRLHAFPLPLLFQGTFSSPLSHPSSSPAGSVAKG